MKKLLLFVVAAASLIAADTASSQPQPAGCALSFQVQIDSYVIVSYGAGSGVVTCSSSDGTVTATAPVSIQISGIGPGLGQFLIDGVAGSIGILEPNQLNGTYAVLEANVGAGPAIGADLGFAGQTNGLSFTGSVQGGEGLGVSLSGTSWTITVTQ
jgi:hypothetical protein